MTGASEGIVAGHALPLPGVSPVSERNLDVALGDRKRQSMARVFAVLFRALSCFVVPVAGGPKAGSRDGTSLTIARFG